MQSLTGVVKTDVTNHEQVVSMLEISEQLEEWIEISWEDPPSEHYSFAIIFSDEVKRMDTQQEVQTAQTVIGDSLSDGTKSIAEVNALGHGRVIKGDHSGRPVLVGAVDAR